LRISGPLDHLSSLALGSRFGFAIWLVPGLFLWHSFCPFACVRLLLTFSLFFPIPLSFPHVIFLLFAHFS
jgi:hypothetical protein